MPNGKIMWVIDDILEAEKAHAIVTETRSSLVIHKPKSLCGLKPTSAWQPMGTKIQKCVRCAILAGGYNK